MIIANILSPLSLRESSRIAKLKLGNSCLCSCRSVLWDTHPDAVVKYREISDCVLVDWYLEGVVSICYVLSFWRCSQLVPILSLLGAQSKQSMLQVRLSKQNKHVRNMKVTAFKITYFKITYYASSYRSWKQMWQAVYCFSWSHYEEVPYFHITHRTMMDEVYVWNAKWHTKCIEVYFQK